MSQTETVICTRSSNVYLAGLFKLYVVDAQNYNINFCFQRRHLMIFIGFFHWSFVSFQVNIQNPIDNIQRHLSDSSRPWTSSISLMCSSSALVNSGLVAPGRFSDDRLSALVAPPTQEGGTMWQKDTRLRVGCRHQVVTTKTILFCLLFA